MTLPSSTTRSAERLRHHYEVERSLADRLRESPRAARPGVYAHMYAELFAEVPDHPRLVRRADQAMIAYRTRRLLRLLWPFLTPASRVLEFGAGDCTLAFAIAPLVRHVVAADISNQIASGRAIPSNFEHVTYDGYVLPVGDGSADVVFSNDLIEHIHPEDVALHFRAAHRVLAPGGVYVFTTPHRFTGPHDVSRHFSDVPEGFHLKEWTFRELDAVMRDAGFSRLAFHRFAKGVPLRQPVALIGQLERWIGPLAPPLRRRLGRLFLPGIIISAVR